MRKLFVEYTVQVRIPVEVEDDTDIDAVLESGHDEAHDIIGAAFEVYDIDYELPETEWAIYDKDMSVIKLGSEE